MTKTTLASLVLLSTAVPALAQPRIVPVGTRPESVCKGFGGLYYVSVQGPAGGPAGDGMVAVIHADGSVAPFATGMDEPKGIAFTGEFLVVTDLRRVWAIDAAGNKTELANEASFPFPIAFLNDAAAEPGGQSVLVTEMGARTLIRDPSGMFWPIDSPQAAAIPAQARVYRIRLDGQVSVAVAPSREALIINGVTRGQGDRLLIAEFFFGNVVELRGTQRRVLATGFRGADGIEQGPRSKAIYLSSFEAGTVWRLDPNGGRPQVLLTNRGRGSTADIHLDADARLLLVPDTAAGTVTLLPVRE